MVHYDYWCIMYARIGIVRLWEFRRGIRCRHSDRGEVYRHAISTR